MPWTLESVRALFAGRGFVLLATRFHTTRDSLRYRCSCGRESTLSVQALLAKPPGQRCRSCAADRRRLPAEQVAAAFLAAGCELRDTYRSAEAPLRFRCSCGRLGMVAYGSFRRGARCDDCTAERRRRRRHA
jgi:hypothetical protein